MTEQDKKTIQLLAGTNSVLEDKNKLLKKENKELKKQLSLYVVSQQRELLKKWWKYFDEESVAINCNDEEREEVINNFFNCG